jgi:hypothetical protein
MAAMPTSFLRDSIIPDAGRVLIASARLTTLRGQCAVASGLSAASGLGSLRPAAPFIREESQEKERSMEVLGGHSAQEGFRLELQNLLGVLGRPPANRQLR